MKITLPSLVLLAASSAGAVTLDVSRLPEPTFADREVSGDSALPAGRTGGDFRVFRLELVFDASPSNNVQVAFGRDNLPADGLLAAEETDWIVGWDCGEWFIRPQGLRERYAFAPQSAAGRRTLTAEIRVSAAGVPQGAVFSDGGAAFTFQGLALAPSPDWLKPDLWTDLRVTVRGGGAAQEDVRARFTADGTCVSVK